MTQFRNWHALVASTRKSKSKNRKKEKKKIVERKEENGEISNIYIRERETKRNIRLCYYYITYDIIIIIIIDFNKTYLTP